LRKGRSQIVYAKNFMFVSFHQGCLTTRKEVAGRSGRTFMANTAVRGKPLARRHAQICGVIILEMRRKVNLER